MEKFWWRYDTFEGWVDKTGDCADIKQILPPFASLAPPWHQNPLDNVFKLILIENKWKKSANEAILMEIRHFDDWIDEIGICPHRVLIVSPICTPCGPLTPKPTIKQCIRAILIGNSQKMRTSGVILMKLWHFWGTESTVVCLHRKRIVPQACATFTSLTPKPTTKGCSRVILIENSQK